MRTFRFTTADEAFAAWLAGRFDGWAFVELSGAVVRVYN